MINSGAVVADLDIATSCDFRKLFVSLEGLVHSIVGHAKQSQFGIRWVVTLREHDELGQERYGNQLLVQLGRHLDRIVDILAVNQPEPGTEHSNTNLTRINAQYGD